MPVIMRFSLFLPVLAILAFAQDSDPKKPVRPRIGVPAPNLRLNDHRGEVVELSVERESWTVLAFFPKAATPG